MHNAQFQWLFYSLGLLLWAGLAKAEWLWHTINSFCQSTRTNYLEPFNYLHLMHLDIEIQVRMLDTTREKVTYACPAIQGKVKN